MQVHAGAGIRTQEGRGNPLDSQAKAETPWKGVISIFLSSAYVLYEFHRSALYGSRMSPLRSSKSKALSPFARYPARFLSVSPCRSVFSPSSNHP